AGMPDSLLVLPAAWRCGKLAGVGRRFGLGGCPARTTGLGAGAGCGAAGPLRPRFLAGAPCLGRLAGTLAVVPVVTCYRFRSGAGRLAGELAVADSGQMPVPPRFQTRVESAALGQELVRPGVVALGSGRLGAGEELVGGVLAAGAGRPGLPGG